MRILRFFVFSLYRLVFLVLLLGFIAMAAAFFMFSSGLPSIDSLRHYQPPLESRIFAGNFQLVSELASERRIYVPYDQIPPIVAQAFISTEDKLFWSEPGINPLAIVRAGLTDIYRVGTGHRLQGASTITEQVVKNMLLENRINAKAKIKELILALRVSQALTKPQILTIYLNEIDLGKNSFGIAAAAQTYFDKPLSQLDIAQAASLAALPKSPSNYNPFSHPQAALQRRNFVIDRMLQDGAITQAQATAAEAEPLLPKAGGTPLTVPDADYFADAVKNQLTQRFGDNNVATSGLIIHTSLNPQLQTAATNAVRDGLEKYDRAHAGWHGLVAHIADPDLADNWTKDLAKQATPPGLREDWQLGIVLAAGPSQAHIGYVDKASGAPAEGAIPLATMRWARPSVSGNLGPHPSATSDVLSPGDIIMVSGTGAAMALEQIPIVQAALISMDPRTGRIFAIVGGWSHDVSPFNRAIQAERQPGSSVKPFVYLTAMEQGVQPDATVLDAPFVLQMPDGSVYRPGNFGNDGLQGPIPLYHALEQSLNLATLHLTQQIGLSNVGKTFHDFGIIDQMPPYFPSAIGAIDTTLLNMVTGYAELDEYGRQITPTLIDDVTNPQGQVLYQAAGQNCDNCTNGDPAQPPSLDYAGQQLSDPDSVFQMITMMKGVVLRGTGAAAVQGITQPVAGKTGTTNNSNDVWFIGFTPGLLTGCWVGFDTPADLGELETGGSVCAPIWNEYMKTALAGQPPIDWPVPDGVTLQNLGNGVTEAFKTGETPGAQSNISFGGTPLAPPSTPTPTTPGTPAPSSNLPGLY
jgi:penicillin-binding protein 1A